MTDFEKWDDRYRKKWCNKGQLQRLVVLGVLTAEDYENITGEEYGQ
ncbi:MAG: XkdX family protein [Clostridiaceae bacterium]|nr:XkdX family protein [Clostridiaceae bacterium]